MSASASAKPASRRSAGALPSPLLDRLIATVAALPFLGLFCAGLERGRLDAPSALLMANLLLQALTLVARRTAQHVSMVPWQWALAFTATYWPFLVAPWTEKGEPVLAAALGDALALIGGAVLIYARLSLGRSIGFVPALRGIANAGAYRWARHPIYSGVFLVYAAFALNHYTPRNLLLTLLGIGWFAFKSLVEERYLLEVSPDYRAYAARVRWRWLPGVL
jgi:protein-S-isoprenylcysteine O-methyltransferase Ste14